jgi:hypothetical protein
MRPSDLVIIGSLVTLLGACRPTGGRTDTGIQWRIADSSWISPWDETVDSIAVYRLVVTHAGVTDTVADAIGPWPVATSDSTIVGVRIRRSDSSRELFQVTGNKLALSAIPLPADLQRQFVEVAVSPGGRYLAYVATDSLAMPRAVVRTIPEGRVLLQGPTTSGCDCDVDLNHARWVTADSFEIAVVDKVSDGGWQLVAGNVPNQRVQVSALGAEPTWHQVP